MPRNSEATLYEDRIEQMRTETDIVDSSTTD